MEIKSYRARSVQEALAMVRADLGPDAAVLHTREVPPGMMRWLGATRQIEVMATKESSRVPSRMTSDQDEELSPPFTTAESMHPFRVRLSDSASEGVSLVEDASLSVTGNAGARALDRLLLQQWPRDLAEEFVFRALDALPAHEASHEHAFARRVARLLEHDLPLCRPIQVSMGQQRVVALVGPTGVGKTTTIAKLAANFRIRQRQRVGLITVDTYRIAAVDQLRTYAEIIDLPMEIVSTPAEMHDAARSMANLDLILIDTAGQSPHDAARMQELRMILAGAPAHETHLVLSTTASSNTLVRTVEQFQPLGVTSMLLTKLDEAYGLGNVAALMRGSRYAVSYMTHGQNVPDDICPAERGRLARAIVGLTAEANHA